jgi:flagellar biosynthesis component FlhA
MSRSGAQAGPLVLSISAAPGPALSQVILQEANEARARIETELAALMQELGVPGRPSVELAPASGQDTAAISLRIGGMPCRFPNELALQAYAYVSGSPSVPLRLPTRAAADAPGPDTDVATAPSEQRAAQADPWDGRAVEVLALICRAAAACQPGVLLTAAQARSYRHELKLPETLTTGRISEVLRAVLELGLSIADQDTVRRVLAEGGASDATDQELVEGLVDALAPDLVELRLHPALLRQLTTDNAARGAETVAFLRDGLFVELGLPLPKFRFRPDPSLQPGGFAFRINHLSTLPMISLPPDRILVNDTAERLALRQVEAVPILNPATWQPGSLVGHEHSESLQADGLTTWDQLGHLILSLADALRMRAAALVHCGLADRMLATLGTAFPDLERPARARIPLHVLSAVLRDLLRDRISIRNLPRILELLLEYETAAEPEPPTDRLTFVRAGLAEQIAAMTSRGTTTTVVYLLDPEIETALAEHQDGLPKRLGDALNAELAFLPPTALRPSVLTEDALRASIGAILRPEFPRVRVVSYSDLPPNHNVMPVARISW